MLKSVISVALLLGVTSVLNAGDDTRVPSDSSEVFVGAEGAMALVQGNSFWDVHHKGSGPSLGLRIGAQNEDWRSMAVVDRFNSDDDDQNYERAMIQVDHFLFKDRFQSDAFRPYIGLNVGYLNYESLTANDNGVAYGGQVGFAAGVSDTVDLDVAFRYDVAVPDNIDHIGNLVFGLNYLY